MTIIRNHARWLLSGVVALSAAACGQGNEQVGAREAESPEITAPSPDSTSSSGRPVVSGELPFDLEAVVAQAKIDFRNDGTGGFVTRQPTHTIQAKNGVLAFTPASFVPSMDRVVTGQTVEIETVAITRDDADLSQGIGTTQADYQSSVRIDRGVAEEHVYNSPTGIEQTWTFQNEPQGSGPLEVRVAIRGQRYVGVDARGHHFIDESTSIGMVYSHATWVDLTGQRTAVPVVFDADVGELVMAVPAEVLASSRYPAVLDPTAQAEQATTAPAIVSSALFEETPVVAFDGTRYLAVWADNRDGDSYDIWATFVNTAAVVQNTTGLLISGATGNQRAPAVAFNGTNYLVTWEDYRRTTPTLTQIDVMGQIVSTAGALVGGELSFTVSGQGGHPDVAALGSSWMVVWEDFRVGANSNVLYSSVTGGGVVSEPLAFNDDPSNEARPAVACATTSCMVVFAAGLTNGEDIFRQRFDANGLIDVASSTISGVAMGRSLLPDIAFDGTNYLSVWQDRRTGHTFIYGQRINAATGANLDGDGFRISPNGTFDHFSPTVAFDGTQYLVAWQDTRNTATLDFDIFGTRVQTSGVVTNPTGFLISAQPQAQRVPRAVAGGGQFFVVWEDDRLGPPANIRGTRVSPVGTVTDTFGTQIATAANRQTAAAIANGGAGSNNIYLLVYNDTRVNGAGNYDLVAVRIAPTGASLDPSGRLLTVGTGSGIPGNQIGPEISFNGTSFLVVWQDGRLGTTNYDVYGAIVTVNNTVGFVNNSGNNGFAISTAANNQLQPTVAWNAGVNQWLVTWGDQRTSANTDIYGARVAANGTVVDANGFAISTLADLQVRPDVASNGGNWLVAWTDRVSGVANTENVVGSIVSAGPVVSPQFTISAAANRQEAVRLAWSGTSYVATWQDSRASLTNYNILAARITPAGFVNDANGVAIANSIVLSETRPRVLRMGNNLFFVWSQQSAVNSTSYDLHGRQFTPTLVSVAPSFIVSNLAGSESQPAIAADSSNTSAVVAYQRYDSTLGVRAERVRFRRIAFP